MKYEETIINGVLHWRKKSNSKWIAKTPQELTQMILETRKQNNISANILQSEYPIYYAYSLFRV